MTCTDFTAEGKEKTDPWPGPVLGFESKSIPVTKGQSKLLASSIVFQLCRPKPIIGAALP